MQKFNYAHNGNPDGGRQTPTAQFNKPNLSEQILKLREDALSREIPTASEETLNFLQTILHSVRPNNILELGTAVGISGAVMLQTCPYAHLTTVERDENFFTEAKTNFDSLGLTDRVTRIFGDAGEIIEILRGEYDFIFLDCAKVQYVKYLPALKRLLRSGGVLAADDVLLYGWITGEAPVPKKRKQLASHVSEYVKAVTEDNGLCTTILNVGDGLALSVKL